MRPEPSDPGLQSPLPLQEPPPDPPPEPASSPPPLPSPLPSPDEPAQESSPLGLIWHPFAHTWVAVVTPPVHW